MYGTSLSNTKGAKDEDERIGYHPPKICTVSSDAIEVEQQQLNYKVLLLPSC